MTVKRANGYIKFHREDDEYIIDLVWVSVGARNNGVATHLIKLAEKYVSQRASCNTISLGVNPSPHARESPTASDNSKGGVKYHLRRKGAF